LRSEVQRRIIMIGAAEQFPQQWCVLLQDGAGRIKEALQALDHHGATTESEARARGNALGQCCTELLIGIGRSQLVLRM
jgi:hypothetical protein